VPDTVTVALDETRPLSSTATRVYVVVAAGETLWDPDLATSMLFRYTWSASVVTHVSVED
jgi:hypothetical protein